VCSPIRLTRPGADQVPAGSDPKVRRNSSLAPLSAALGVTCPFQHSGTHLTQ